MISGIDLFSRYCDEKDLIIGNKDERTSLEPFDSYKIWKAKYTAEYNETHVTVDVKEADKMMDALVDEAVAELTGVDFREDPKEYAEAQPKPILVTHVVGRASRQKKKKKTTKAFMAQAIFNEMAGKSRQEVIAQFISQAGMTKAGASTYFQRFKSLAA